VNDEENKLKEAFELSDLLYSKRKDEIMSGLEEKLSEITEEFIGAGGYFDTRHVEFLLKERIKRVKELVPHRLNYDLQNIEKVISPIMENIYKKIYKRALGSIEEEMKNVRVHMIDFFVNDSFFLSSCLKPMNKTVDEEKCRLLENAERDMEIFQKRFELKIGIDDFSEEQKRDYKKHEYKCKDKIYILGTSQYFRSNGIIINEVKMTIGDSILKLLLRFLVELKKGSGGWISRDTILDENIFNSDDPDHPKGIEDFRIYYELRKALKGYLLKKDSNKFIENDRKKHYRISTHPDFIKYDREKLLSHKDPQIKRLAEELP